MVEISIVISIIAFLIAMITQSIAIIKSSKITNARNITINSGVEKIKGLVAWYETSLKESLKIDEIQDGSNISAWYDINPYSIVSQHNTLSRSPSSAITYLENGINNLPSIEFHGQSNGNLTLDNLKQGDLKEATLFFVLSANAYNLTFFDSFFGRNATFYSYVASQLSLNAGLQAWTSTSSNTIYFTLNKKHILVSYLKGSESRFYFDNTDDVVGGATINPGNNSISGITLGSKRGGSSPFSGRISEIIIFDRILSKPERKDVMKYLSKKYDIRIEYI